MSIVYQWYSGGYFSMTPAQREAADDFVRAHDIDPRTVTIDNSLVVEVDDDGDFWLRTWRAVTAGPKVEFRMCPHCPGCVEQEQVRVPLVMPVPELPGAFLDRDSGLPVAEPAGS